MLFNSLDFAIFLPVCFFVYWFLAHKNLRLQNASIVVSSYFFYGCWDWRFLSLILFSTLVDYGVGIGLEKEANKSKRVALLWTSICVNLGFLGFFIHLIVEHWYPFWSICHYCKCHKGNGEEVAES